MTAPTEEPRVDELFGRGDQCQWHRYTRSQHPFVFEVWDAGDRNLFSGCENTQFFTREEAMGRLSNMGWEQGSLARALGLDEPEVARLGRELDEARSKTAAAEQDSKEWQRSYAKASENWECREENHAAELSEANERVEAEEAKVAALVSLVEELGAAASRWAEEHPPLVAALWKSGRLLADLAATAKARDARIRAEGFVSGRATSDAMYNQDVRRKR